MPIVTNLGSKPIPKIDGNAQPNQVLNERTFYNDDYKTKRVGTMPNRGAVSKTLGFSETFVIAEGYHNGGGRITAPAQPPKPIPAKLKQLGVVSLYGAGLGNTPTQHKSATFNVASVYSRYRDLTTNDFPIPLKSCSAGTAEQFGNCGITSMSYNPSNGVLTIYYDASSYFNSAGADVYIYVLDRYGL